MSKYGVPLEAIEALLVEEAGYLYWVKGTKEMRRYNRHWCWARRN